jgi:glycosyltransferase involved in cell wall biosynthesis
MSLISIVTQCFNEEENVVELHERIKAQFNALPQHSFEHIFIDNASTDGTVKKIKELAVKDKRVKLIVNTRNFGHLRSPFHAVLQARGDAVVSMASDLQDPPELIPQFIAKWEEGFKAVLGVKPTARETFVMSVVRGAYYRILGRISEVTLVKNFTGFGLYDRWTIEIIRKIEDPYPYFRGLMPDLGIEYATIPFEQPKRVRGITKNNFYTLYDLAMLGITSHSKLPIRLAAMAGFTLSIISLAVSVFYLIWKLLFWESFEVGIAPLLIALFFFSSVQLLFIGIIGEYVGAIHTHVRKRPLVVEKERVNFDSEGG